MTAGSYIPYVRFRLGDGTTAQISPGGLIGRAASAELRIANPEVSEAHALISLRGHQLHMLSLRRWIILDGERCSAITLKPGQRIFLSQTVVLEVEAVELPDHVFVLGCDDREVCTLSESVYSLMRGEDGIKVLPEHVQGAEAYLWGNAEGFTLRVGDAAPVEVEAGTEWKLGEHRLRITARPLGDGALSTRSIGQNDPPLTIVARYDTVYIHTPGRAPASNPLVVTRYRLPVTTAGSAVARLRLRWPAGWWRPRSRRSAWRSGSHRRPPAPGRRVPAGRRWPAGAFPGPRARWPAPR